MNIVTKINRSMFSMLSTKLFQVVPQARNFSALTTNQKPNAVVPLLNAVTPNLSQRCGMKVKGRCHLRCKDCYFVWREERIYVMCKTHPRHKQMGMKKRDYNTWILTDATQSKFRPF